MSPLPRRLGARLNIFLVVLLAGLGVAASIVVFAGFQQSESNASRASREGIESFGADTIGVFALLASESADISLVPLEQVTRTAAAFILEASTAAATADQPLETMDSGARYDPAPGRRSDIWVPSGVAQSTALERDLALSAPLDLLLPRELEQHPDAQAAYFIAASGLTRFYPPIGLHDLLEPAQVHTAEPVFELAAPGQNPGRETIWTDPYDNPAGPGLLISVSTPVYDGDEFIGVIGVDIALEELVASVNQLRPSPNGYGFVIDGEGEILPSNAQPTVQAALDDPVLALPTGRVLAAMQAGQFGAERLTLGGQEVVVGYAPLRSIGGSIALVTPVDDITEQAGVAAVTDTITREGRRTLGFIGITILTLFAVAVFVGAYMTRRLLIWPIDRLVGATASVAAGNLDTEIPVARHDELGDLAAAFNNMTGRLAVRETELRRETEERERTEEELKALFAAMSDVVVVVHRDGTYLRIAPAGREFLQRLPEELLGRNLSEFFPPGQTRVFLDCIARALDENTTQVIEYQLPATSTWFLGAVSPMTGDRVVWVARDITERVRSRQILEQAVDERTRQLSTLIDVSRTTASTIEITPLLDTIIEQLGKVIEFDGAAVIVLEGSEEGEEEGGDLVILDSRGPTGREQELIGDRLSVGRLGVIWEGVRTGKPVVVADMHGDSPEASALRGALRPGLMEIVSPYIRSWMAVPMQTRDHIVGFISVSRSEPGYFGQSHAELVSAFANFAAIAIDNARLFEEAQRHIRQNTALARVTSNLQFAELLEDNLDNLAKDVVEAAGISGCSIILTTESPPFFGRGGQYGLPGGYLNAMRASWERGAMLIGPADFTFGQPCIAPGGRTRMLTDPGFEPMHSLLPGAQFEDVVVAPLSVNGVLGGSVNLYIPRGRTVMDEDIRFSRDVAAQVSIVASNAALFQQSERRAHDLEVILTAADRLSATLEIRPLIEIALDQVSLIAPHDGEGVYLLEDDAVHLFQRRGGEFTGPPEGMRVPRDAAGPLLDRALRGEVIRLDDVHSNSPAARDYLASVQAAHLQDGTDGICSHLCVPLMVSGRVIGALSLSSRQSAAFDDRHRRLAQGVAYQMAVAFENARLFSETRKREQENRALASVASALELDQPVAATLDAIARGIVETTEAVACSVTLQDDAGDYVLGGSHGLDRGFSTAMASAVVAGAPSAALQVFRTRTPRVLRNARTSALEEQRYAPVHDMFRRANWEDTAIFPLIYRGRAIGSMATYYPSGVDLDPGDIALLASLASQAAFAVENARLFAETVRRERENRALASVSSALSLDQPIAATLDAIAHRVVETTDAIGCGVTLLDERGDFLLGGDVGLPDGFVQAMVESIATGAPSAVYDVMRTGEPQIHTGLREYFRNNPRFAPVATLIDGAEWDSAAVVPLAYRGRVIGSLSAFYPPHIVPGEEELALLSGVASQAAFAAENARLFTEMEERAIEMEALYRADEELYRSLEISHVFQALVDVAVDVLGCDTSALFQWNAPNRELILAAHRGFSPETVTRASELRLSGTLFEALERGEVVCVEDSATVGVNRHITQGEGIVSYMHVPITIDGDVFGIYNVGYRRMHPFPPEERRLGLALSQRAAVAIQNARLYEQAQQAASLEERQRIARDLHDSVSQALYGIGLGAKTARTLIERDPKLVEQPLDYILALSEAGLAELRALIFELRPDSLATDGLVAALERQVAATRARHQLTVEAHLIAEPAVPLDIKEAIYRIAQESMTNAIKHARATELSVRLAWENDFLELTVADNGLGFDPGGDFPGHMGLRSMRERAHRLGGTVDISSAPGAGTGTSIRIALPTPP